MSITRPSNIGDLWQLIPVQLLALLARQWVTLLGIRMPDRPVLKSGQIETSALPRGSVIIVELAAADVFVARRTLPVAPRRHQLAVLRHALPTLAPIKPSLLEMAVAPTRVGQSTRYDIAMVRSAHLDAIEAIAAGKGIRVAYFKPSHSEELKLATNRIRRSRTARIAVEAGAAAAAIIAAVVMSVHVAKHIDRDSQSMTAQYEATRRMAVDLDRARHEANISNALLSRGVLERRPGVVLSDLADINGALPDSAFLTAFRWTPGRLALEGVTNEGVTALQTLASSTDRWRVEVAGGIRSGPAGSGQRFELQARRRTDDE